MRRLTLGRPDSSQARWKGGSHDLLEDSREGGDQVGQVVDNAFDLRDIDCGRGS